MSDEIYTNSNKPKNNPAALHNEQQSTTVDLQTLDDTDTYDFNPYKRGTAVSKMFHVLYEMTVGSQIRFTRSQQYNTQSIRTLANKAGKMAKEIELEDETDLANHPGRYKFKTTEDIPTGDVIVTLRKRVDWQKSKDGMLRPVYV